MQAPYAHLLSRIEGLEAARQCAHHAQWIKSLEAALKEMCLVHFPYGNPNDDPEAKRSELQKMMIGALNGEPYKA